MLALEPMDAQAARAYTIAALAGGARGIDRYVLEGLLGYGTGPLIDRMISRHHLVEVGNGRIVVAGRPPQLTTGG